MKHPPFLACIALFLTVNAASQKKPLDHSVYDAWEHIGDKLISHDGQWVVYTIEPQEGDGKLYVRSSDGRYTKMIDRAYGPQLTHDGRYLVFRIRPLYKDTREARIKKRKPEEFPKDSLGILELGKGSIWKEGPLKGFKLPAKGSDWIAFQKERPESTRKSTTTADKRSDSLQRVIDSLQRLLNEPAGKKKKKKNKDGDQDEEDDLYQGAFSVNAEGDENASEGSELILRSLLDGREEVFTNVIEYLFSEKGNKLLLRQGKDGKDPASKPTVSIYDLSKKEFVTILRGGNDFRNFSFSKKGDQLAFVAEREAKPKNLVKHYKLWYYKEGWDSAQVVADRYSVGMPLGSTVSEFGSTSFSRSGDRLFFGTAPNPIAKDTTLIEAEMPKMDLWHYNDDYLQTTQLQANRLRAAQQQNYLAVYNTLHNSIQQLGSREIPQVLMTDEGDGEYFAGVTDFGKRIESQWEGTTVKDIYFIEVRTGEAIKIAGDINGNIYPSPGGTAIAWFDRKKKKYFAWTGGKVRTISDRVTNPLYNEEHDSPGPPGNYGVMGWQEGDSALYVYDMYDVWKLDVPGDRAPLNITKGMGRKDNVEIRYQELDPEKRFFRHGETLLFRTANKNNKTRGLRVFSTDGLRYGLVPGEQPMQFSDVRAARENPRKLIYLKESFTQSPNIYVASFDRDMNESHHHLDGEMPLLVQELRLSSTNTQQSDYLWGTAELLSWKAYDGKEATGIVYKPENFDPKKKYPMIVYFYERLSQDLYDYKEPAPIRSALNIPFFVSRGYVVFLPDIRYEIGHPGKSAYDYIVSGSRALVKKGFVDSTKIGIQGHSWGGYQAAQLATMTKLFRAVWAGAPVANMTSAYGGIRWESGLSRQFQYERTQSRLGVTPWENLDLYIENSPLFHLDKVTAPMVIMHNDADGAVPWYQGIELFTALRRLGKMAWMFNYNGQGHGLTQRQDMRDYQIRMQQFFDWILKDETPARWITDGIPAIEKGRTLGY